MHENAEQGRVFEVTRHSHDAVSGFNSSGMNLRDAEKREVEFGMLVGVDTRKLVGINSRPQLI